MNSSTIKLFVIAVISLLLMIPAVWIGSLVSEREAYRNSAAQEVQSMWGGPQTVGAPILSIPYSYLCQRTQDGKIIESVCSSQLRLYPKKLDAKVQLPTSERKRGIYPIPLYQATVRMNFHFAEPDYGRLGIDPEKIHWQHAHLSLHIEDLRGIKASPVLSQGDESWELTNESVQGRISDNSLVLPFPESQKYLINQIPMDLDVRLNGSESFYLLPLAQEASVQMDSDWPHPGFSGMFLPEHRLVNEKGFQAAWKITSLNHSAAMAWTFSGKESTRSEISVGFKQTHPVDHYSMTDRAIKYVILFIALTFILTYFAERMTGANIHPLQYILIGTSLLLFYTLLLSLSESIGFAGAYAISTIAITAQIGVFIKALIHHRKAALLGPLVLSMLYGFLFVLLRLEDLALLAGSIGLFFILGALMYISTRFNKANP